MHAGIDPNNSSLSSNYKRLMNEIVSSPQIYALALAQYAEDVSLGKETKGIQFYDAAQDDDETGIIDIIAVPFVGKPIACSAQASACMAPPDPDSKYGTLIAEFHPHPIDNGSSDLPSEKDFSRSQKLGVPGMIFANMGQNQPMKVINYEAHCLQDSCSSEPDVP
jgi:hypothetical protein